MTDEQAMWQVRNAGDPVAFAHLVARWEAPIQRLCERMLADHHRGQDVAQETFAKLFAHRLRYEPSGRFSTFLWRVALNLCYDELRRIQRRGESTLPAEDEELAEGGWISSDPTPDENLEGAERADSVRKALAALPESYRAVLVLRHYENLKFREIAEVLGLPEGTVKSRMAEALNRMSHALQRLSEPGTAPRHRNLNQPEPPIQRLPLSL